MGIQSWKKSIQVGKKEGSAQKDLQVRRVDWVCRISVAKSKEWIRFATTKQVGISEIWSI